ncbi:MAG: hypothetical protein U0Q18_33670 [Bryobacteraceae bacterium]
MRLDPEFLREHYSSLSDESLLDIDRSDLVGMAQQCYDAEVARRGLDGTSAVSVEEPALASPPDFVPSDALYSRAEVPDPGDTPAWLGEAAEVYSAVVLATRHEEERVGDARQVLEDAGIPCYPELVELTPEEKAPVAATHRWRLLVPGKLNLQAISTLERDLSNPDFEAGWRAHLEACSNSELSRMRPQAVFCGLFDRVARVTQAYEEEILRRRLNPRKLTE